MEELGVTQQSAVVTREGVAVGGWGHTCLAVSLQLPMTPMVRHKPFLALIPLQV